MLVLQTFSLVEFSALSLLNMPIKSYSSYTKPSHITSLPTHPLSCKHSSVTSTNASHPYTKSYTRLSFLSPVLQHSLQIQNNRSAIEVSMPKILQNPTFETMALFHALALLKRSLSRDSSRFMPQAYGGDDHQPQAWRGKHASRRSVHTGTR